MSTEPQGTHIQDAGSLHKYRTEIPNTVVRGLKSRGLSIYAKWLYVYLKSVNGDGGVCYRNTTTIAAESGMSRGQVSNAKHELLRHGLITVKKGQNPSRDVDHIRIKDIWLANMQEFCVHTVNADQGEEDLVSQEDNHFSVHTVNTETLERSPHEHQSSYSERSVHTVNQRRSHEEDPMKKEKTPHTPRASKRCPADFIPSAELRAAMEAKYPHVDFDEALEAMKDWEFKDAKTDWPATLRTWIRTEDKRSGPGGGIPPTPRLTFAEEAIIRRDAKNAETNKQLEELALGINAHNSVWGRTRHVSQSVPRDVGPGSQRRLPPSVE